MLKTGRMWCGGARETRESHVTIGRIVSKKEITKTLPAFQDLGGKNFLDINQSVPGAV